MNQYQIKKEKAREKAIDAINNISQNNYSYYELFIIQNKLYKIGKKYGILKEFKENCII